MTVSEALQDAQAKLAGVGIDPPRREAQWLLAWALRCRREDLAREPERILSDREQVIFQKAIALRAERRPLAYITGEQTFYGRSFKINRAVLIPRPETELLVEAALEKCANIPAPVLADIGTGSACLGVSLACERPDARVWATDLSRLALLVARKNVVRYGVQERLTLCEGDLLAPLPPEQTFDVIVSNPPYVMAGELPTLQPEVRDYEPPLALVGQDNASGPDGTALHQRLLQEGTPFLKSGGWLLLEIGMGQADVIAELARTLGYSQIAVQKDYAGIPRIVLARWEGCTLSGSPRIGG